MLLKHSNARVEDLLITEFTEGGKELEFLTYNRRPFLDYPGELIEPDVEHSYLSIPVITRVGDAAHFNALIVDYVDKKIWFIDASGFENDAMIGKLERLFFGTVIASFKIGLLDCGELVNNPNEEGTCIARTFEMLDYFLESEATEEAKHTDIVAWLNECLVVLTKETRSCLFGKEVNGDLFLFMQDSEEEVYVNFQHF